MDMNWIPSNLIPMQGSQIDLGKVGDIVKGMDYDAKQLFGVLVVSIFDKLN